MINVIDEAKSNGDSVGGSFEVIAKGNALWFRKLYQC